MTAWLWIGFVLVVLVFLAIDLGVFHRNARRISAREATIWTLVWIATALLFNVGVYFLYEHHVFGIGTGVASTMSDDTSVAADDSVESSHGNRTALDRDGDIDGSEAALEFFTGYVIEK